MALIAHTIKASTDGADVTTDPIDTTGADFIVITTSMFDAYANSITDNYGNTIAPAIADFGALFSFFGSVGSYILRNPNVGPGHTFTCATSAKKPSMAIQAWSGVGATVEDGQHTSTSNTSVGYASITPPAADTLILLTLARNTASMASPSAGFTMLGEVDPSANNVGLNHAYMLTPDTSDVVPGWTWPTSSADKGGGFGAYGYAELPPDIVFVFGENGSVSSRRTALFNVDGVTRTVHEPDTVVIGSDLHVLGDLTVDGSIIGALDMEDVVSRLLITEDGVLVLDDDGVPLYSEE